MSGATVERKMRRLDNFAAESLFTKTKSNRTIRARTFCEIFLLPSDEFQQIIYAQCDRNTIDKMKETAETMAKNASKANKLFGSADDPFLASGFKLIFYPNSAFRYTWDLVALLGYVFYIFSVPLMVMRYLDGAKFNEHLFSFCTSYLWDIYFVADLYLSFNHFMHHHEGLVVFDRDRIRQKFLEEHNAWLDFIAALPIDVLGTITSRWCFLLRLSKLVRLPQLLRSINKLERVMADSKLDKGLTVLKIATLNLALIVTCHWIACLWHSCASIGLSIGFETTWLLQDEEDPTLSINHSELNGFGAYLRSIYWAIVGTTTVGYGDIIPQNILETTVATVVILFGGLFLPAIVGA